MAEVKQDIFKLISNNKNTVREFSVWLVTKLNGDRNLYAKLTNANNVAKIPYLVQYLESLGVPMLEAMCYYNTKLLQPVGLQDLIIFTILMEFKRIEKGEQTDYVPF